MQSSETRLASDNIRPLIKWTGGKYKEFAKFSQYIPAFDNYYEPFFGGGGVFFALQPKKQCFLNDKSVDLISFYRLLQQQHFQAQLDLYVLAWEQTTRLYNNVSADLLEIFREFIAHGFDKLAVQKKAETIFNEIDEKAFAPLFDDAFIINANDFKKVLAKSIADKFNRIKNIQSKQSECFASNELRRHIETSIKSALYLHLRNISNKCSKGQLTLLADKATANWYFVREFCYASMFRFSKKGGFNIPYGGIAYNKKKFRSKVKAITSARTEQLFKNAGFFNLDFEKFLEKQTPLQNDFVFLDPPYDSEFSEYDQNTFSKDDQVRLRNWVLQSPAKCMMVIKETAFIRELYKSDSFNIIEFDKTYTYNVRGRNNRGTKHLIILNYKCN